ncbi:MAG: FAD-dependent oxidoreductase [Burkholderiaceae bacterium]|nr:FAD-dependent oxidoreductase [Burkholderiaceae bacterium]
MGCSVAYHLSALGEKDVVLLEQGRLTSGTTWHAAGLVGQLRAHESMTRLIRYSTELYAKLEEETGLATGWKQCGSLAVARTADRMIQLRRTAAAARAHGVACEVISPAEAGERYPIMATHDLQGAVWLPGDGKANPTDLTLALAKGARNRGVKIFENVRVDGMNVLSPSRAKRVNSLAWRSKPGERGVIRAEIVVLCGGQWSREVARLADVSVPLFSCEHFYIVTDRIEGVHRELPVLRDPDGYIYFKEEVGGLLMGGFEPNATPWLQSARHRGGIPENFEFQLLPDNWDAFQILLENAMIRVPALETAQVKQFYNGPESFTADNNFILGPAPSFENFYVGCGFNSMGIASAGGAGKALAEWIVQGEPTLDLWPVDIRRFGSFNANENWLPDRISEVLGMHYKMPWPNRELESARPFRRSPLYSLLHDASACFGSKMGWERANFFAPSREQAHIDYSWGHQNWHAWVAEEHRACRERVAIFDMSSFAKLLIKGPDAQRALNSIIANDAPVALGATVYTGMLNLRGGYESDFTVTMVKHDEYMIVTGSAQAVRDRDVIERALADLPDAPRCQVIDITSMYAVVAVMGPQSRALLQGVSTTDFSPASFPFGASRDIDVGYATVRATRLTYVGELGWELYVPVEFAVGVYDALMAAGAKMGVANAGYYAIDSLRLEKGYRAWGRELSPDINPYEAGLGFAAKLNKPGGFRGRDALAAIDPCAVKRRIVSLVIDAPHTNVWSNELILRDSEPVGFISSAAFGHTIGKPVALGLVTRTDGWADRAWIESGRYEIDLAGERYAATVSLKAPYDPDSRRVKS